MLDSRARAVLHSPVERATTAIDQPWITPNRLTLVGLLLGVASAAAAASGLWVWALAAFLLSRIFDGLDGALARRRCAPGESPPAFGGYLDIVADFTVYGSFVVGVAIGSGGSLLPFLVVLLAYYINGSTLLALSAVLGDRNSPRSDHHDGRSIVFTRGFAEGTETIVVHALWCILPFAAAPIAWIWAAVVLLTAGQRVVLAAHTLR